MVGFESKREMAMMRYADSETVDHIIDLRNRLYEAERQRDNALAHANQMVILRAENDWLKDKVLKLNGVIVKLSNELKTLRDEE